MPPSRIGLYSPKQKFAPEILDRAEKQYPRPQVEIEFELGHVALMEATLAESRGQ